MTRTVSPAVQAFGTNLAHLVCAYRWRAEEPGAHSPAKPCPACVRLVRDDLHGLVGWLVMGAYVAGFREAEDRAGATLELPDFDTVAAAVGWRGAEICREHLERVVRPDPWTWERVAEGGG